MKLSVFLSTFVFEFCSMPMQIDKNVHPFRTVAKSSLFSDSFNEVSMYEVNSLFIAEQHERICYYIYQHCPVYNYFITQI